MKAFALIQDPHTGIFQTFQALSEKVLQIQEIDEQIFETISRAQINNLMSSNDDRDRDMKGSV